MNQPVSVPTTQVDLLNQQPVHRILHNLKVKAPAAAALGKPQDRVPRTRTEKPASACSIKKKAKYSNHCENPKQSSHWNHRGYCSGGQQEQGLGAENPSDGIITGSPCGMVTTHSPRRLLRPLTRPSDWLDVAVNKSRSTRHRSARTIKATFRAIAEETTMPRSTVRHVDVLAQ